MSTVLKADIFFFISSVSVVLVTLALLVLCYYAVQALKEVRGLAQAIRAEVELIRTKQRRALERIRFIKTFTKLVFKYLLRRY